MKKMVYSFLGEDGCIGCRIRISERNLLTENNIMAYTDKLTAELGKQIVIINVIKLENRGVE